MQTIPGLACPACRGDLRPDSETGLACTSCQRSYPVFEDIPSFIPSPVPDRSTLCQLTVLVPALNEAANLQELLPSIRRELQSLGIDHELLVVDGGSTDGTADVVALPPRPGPPPRPPCHHCWDRNGCPAPPSSSI